MRPQKPPPRPRHLIPRTLRESIVGKRHFARYPPPYRHTRPRRIIPGTAGVSLHTSDCIAQGY